MRSISRVICLLGGIGLVVVGCDEGSKSTKQGKSPSAAPAAPMASTERPRVGPMKAAAPGAMAAMKPTARVPPTGPLPGDEKYAPLPPRPWTMAPPKGVLSKVQYRGPQVFVNRVKVKGSLDAASVRRTLLRRYLPSLNRCYVTLGLAKRPKLAGVVMTAFEVTPEGRPVKVEVGSSTADMKAIEPCVKSVIERVRLPKPVGKAPCKVVCPIVFKVFPVQ
jgi:hypothetical protein